MVSVKRPRPTTMSMKSILVNGSSILHPSPPVGLQKIGCFSSLPISFQPLTMATDGVATAASTMPYAIVFLDRWRQNRPIHVIVELDPFVTWHSARNHHWLQTNNYCHWVAHFTIINARQSTRPFPACDEAEMQLPIVINMKGKRFRLFMGRNKNNLNIICSLENIYLSIHSLSIALLLWEIQNETLTSIKNNCQLFYYKFEIIPSSDLWLPPG